jgi:hypothetical protein
MSPLCITFAGSGWSDEPDPQDGGNDAGDGVGLACWHLHCCRGTELSEHGYLEQHPVFCSTDEYDVRTIDRFGAGAIELTTSAGRQTMVPPVGSTNNTTGKVGNGWWRKHTPVASNSVRPLRPPASATTSPRRNRSRLLQWCGHGRRPAPDPSRSADGCHSLPTALTVRQ